MSLYFDKAIFIDVFNMWFNEVTRPSVSLSTINRYDIEYRKRIKTSSWANMKLIDIKPIHIQTYYNEIAKKNTPHTLKSLNTVVSTFFNYCLKTDLIGKNPLLAVQLPKIPETKKLINF